MRSMSLLGGLGACPQENFEKLDTQICNFSVFYCKILTILHIASYYVRIQTPCTHYISSLYRIKLTMYMMDISKIFYTFHKIQLVCNLHL